MRVLCISVWNFKNQRHLGVAVVVQRKQIRLGTMRLRVQSPASLSGLRILRYGIGCRRGLDLMLLWLWCRLATTAPTGPLAWEPPHAVGEALKSKKKKKKKKKKKLGESPWMF